MKTIRAKTGRKRKHHSRTPSHVLVGQWLLCALLAFMPLAFGAVQAWSESVLLIGSAKGAVFADTRQHERLLSI